MPDTITSVSVFTQLTLILSTLWRPVPLLYEIRTNISFLFSLWNRFLPWPLGMTFIFLWQWWKNTAVNFIISGFTVLWHNDPPKFNSNGAKVSSLRWPWASRVVVSVDYHFCLCCFRRASCLLQSFRTTKSIVVWWLFSYQRLGKFLWLRPARVVFTQGYSWR